MPRLCEPCRLHSADDTLNICPACGGPLKFTLLPPPAATDPPHESGEAAPPPPRPWGFADLFSGKLLWASLAVLILVPAVVVGVWAVGGDTFDRRVGKLKVGMPMRDAMRVMGDDNRQKGKRPAFHFTIGGKQGQDDPNRFADFDAPLDVWGEGWVEYEEGAEAVRVSYSTGAVTAVERTKAEGGLRKRYTYR